MDALLTISAPIFGLIFTGAACARLRLFGDGGAAALNAFVYRLALPTLFFITLARAPLESILNWAMLGALASGQIATYGSAMLLASFLFPGRLDALSQHGMAGALANAGYIGVPLLTMTSGADAALPALLAATVNGALLIPLCAAILGWRCGGVRDAAAQLEETARAPLLLATIAGLAVSALGVEIPSPIAQGCDLLAVAAAPCALLAVGLALTGNIGPSITTLETLWVSAVKLVLHPALTWLLATLAFRLPVEDVATVTILAALPTGGMTFVLSQRFGIYSARATAIILSTTLLSLGTVSALLVWFQIGG